MIECVALVLGLLELGGKNRICLRRGREEDLKVMNPIYNSLGWIVAKPQDRLFISEVYFHYLQSEKSH
jgi:hypothetical protein